MIVRAMSSAQDGAPNPARFEGTLRCLFVIAALSRCFLGDESKWSFCVLSNNLRVL